MSSHPAGELAGPSQKEPSAVEQVKLQAGEAASPSQKEPSTVEQVKPSRLKQLGEVNKVSFSLSPLYCLLVMLTIGEACLSRDRGPVARKVDHMVFRS